MALLNTFSCSAAFGNTGVSKCSLIPSMIVGMFLVPNNFVIKEEDAADLLTYLQKAAKNPSKSLRLFPIHDFTGFTDGSEEPVTETTGYGDAIPVRDGNYNWTFRFIKGGICLLKSLQKFNGQNMSALFVDSNGLLFGRNVANGLAGVPLKSFFANKWTPTDGSNVANFTVNVVFEPKHINENFGFVKDEELDLSQVVGLQDIAIVPTGAQTGAALSVSAVASCVGDNLFDLFSTELASGEVWKVSNKNTGDDLVVDSVSANAITKTFTLTIDPAATSDVVVNLVSVDELEAKDIEGFEGVPAVIKLP